MVDRSRPYEIQTQSLSYAAEGKAPAIDKRELVCCPAMNFDNSRHYRSARQGARTSNSGAFATTSTAASRFDGK